MATTLALGNPATGRRYDPLRTFQFRIGLLPSGSTSPGGYVGGVQKVSGLVASIEADETWEGGNNVHSYKNPRRITWEPIVLEQGIALDDSLEAWARAVMTYVRTGKAPADAVKRNIVIDVWDPVVHTGSTADANGDAIPRVRRFQVFNAWVSKYQALPALDAMANQIGLVSIELHHEGWKRLEDVPGDLLPATSTPPT